MGSGCCEVRWGLGSDEGGRGGEGGFKEGEVLLDEEGLEVGGVEVGG